MGLLSFWMLPFGSFSYTFSTQVSALLVVILVFLLFPRALLFVVCCLGHSPHVSQTVAGWLHLWTGGKQAQDPPGSLHTIVSPVEWSSLKGRSPRWFTVRKTDLLYKDATCCNLWPCDFTDVIAFLSILSSLWLFKFFTNFFFMVLVVLFQGHLSPLSAAFSGCLFGLFCPVLLGGGFLALHRAPISSDWFFIWHSLRPSSTQLLVHNHSGFCSHWYLAGLLFLQSTSFYRLCFSLPPCFSFKCFCSF